MEKGTIEEDMVAEGKHTEKDEEGENKEQVGEEESKERFEEGENRGEEENKFEVVVVVVQQQLRGVVGLALMLAMLQALVWLTGIWFLLFVSL